MKPDIFADDLRKLLLKYNVKELRAAEKGAFIRLDEDKLWMEGFIINGNFDHIKLRKRLINFKAFSSN